MPPGTGRELNEQNLCTSDKGGHDTYAISTISLKAMLPYQDEITSHTVPYHITFPIRSQANWTDAKLAAACPSDLKMGQQMSVMPRKSVLLPRT